MRVDLLDYDLPTDQIAQAPPTDRDGGRLLVVEPRGAEDVGLVDSKIVNLPELLADCRPLVVVNDTRVIRARLLGKKLDTGGRVEIFLVSFEKSESHQSASPGGPARSVPGEVWRAMGRSSKPFRVGSEIVVGDGLTVRILERSQDDGLLRVHLSSARPIAEAIEAHGLVPLPPYIKRDQQREPGRYSKLDDADRYQTLFAKHNGSVAAPTAGLHLSAEILERLTALGVSLAKVTLHVGLGTFQPVHVHDLDDHRMHEESFEVSDAAACAVNDARRAGRPVVAVGTTVVRALESAARRAQAEGSADPIVACRGMTKLLLQPGDSFRVTDALLTNFHLPRSTLLALVAAFMGVDNVRATYAHALAARYRFYSYGDAMFIRSALGAKQRPPGRSESERTL